MIAIFVIRVKYGLTPFTLTLILPQRHPNDTKRIQVPPERKRLENMTYFFLTIAAAMVFVSPIVALINILCAVGSVMIDRSEAKSVEQHAARMRKLVDSRR